MTRGPPRLYLKEAWARFWPFGGIQGYPPILLLIYLAKYEKLENQ